MTDTLTPEKREEIVERIRLALRAVRSSEWPDTAMPVFKVLEEDIPALDRALEAAIERAEKAEAENVRLRAALANSELPCVYCTLPKAEWEKCSSGFPGCARADDAVGCPELGAAMELTVLKARVAELEARGPLLVFDWAYDDPKTGHQLYARTPERAKELQARGVKLTPVYTLDAAIKEKEPGNDAR